ADIAPEVNRDKFQQVSEELGFVDWFPTSAKAPGENGEWIQNLRQAVRSLLQEIMRLERELGPEGVESDPESDG
ncbi:hypothetical protein KIPB_016605, partial [Kipferlia bialata]